jgi:hypothetical protein
MKILEAYTPAQIRACGQMLERSFEHGLELGDFLELAATLKAQAAHPMMQKFRLVFSVNGDSNSSNESVLEAFSHYTLRTWLKMKELFEERKIERQDIRSAIRRIRSADLKNTKYGRGAT